MRRDVSIVEVGARDGLQNEKTPVATADKFAFIERLVAAGVRRLEVTSFVRPEAIPQLADAEALVALVNAHQFPADVEFSCLVPNMKGMEKALALGVREIALFVAASDAFSKRNINATVEESFERIAPVAALAKDKRIKIRGYLSTVFGCPYGEEIAVVRVAELTKRLLAMGCYEVSLGDTTGVGTPSQVEMLVKALADAEVPLSVLALHCHDTRGMALANVLTGYRQGIRTFDASAGGLGGCPYAKGASGNVATEELLYLFESLGVATGIDQRKVWEASSYILSKIGRESPSKLHRAMGM